MSTLKRVAIVFVSLFLLMQFIRFDKTNPKSNPALELKADEKVSSIFKESCYDCHSNQTKYPLYSEVAPISWIVAKHVSDGRKWLNFSEWEGYDEAKKTKLKKLIYREIGEAMPLQPYAMVHEGADLTTEERNIIRAWTGFKAGDVSTRD